MSSSSSGRKKISSSSSFKKPKRLGLVWEQKTEQVIEDCKEKLPVLKEVQSKSIITDLNKPTNLLIEGDNYHSLSALNYTHKEKVNVIYIDPPYNKGNGDFIYNDKFVDEEDSYKHSKWISFMSERLKLAKKLLTRDGVIFISIDDKECAHLRLLCDEIFGESNFSTEFVWEKKKKPSFLHANVGKVTEYILCYVKDKEQTFPFSLETTTRGKKYPFNNSGNSYSTLFFPKKSVRFSFKEKIINPQNMSEGNIKTRLIDKVVVKNWTNQNDFRLKGEWRYSQSTLDSFVEKGSEIRISKIPFRPNLIKQGGEIKKMKNLFSLQNYDMESNEDATKELTFILGGVCDFKNPKPTHLIKTLIKSVTYHNKNALILDFFAGTGTTGHAVLDLNKEDNGNRKFILCTNNENNICTNITYPRIKNVMKGYEFEGEDKKKLLEEKLDIKSLKNSEKILEKIRNTKEKNKNKYFEIKIEDRNGVLRVIGFNKVNGKKQGLGGNLGYFKTDFIPYKDKATDSLKMKITENSTDLLCIKENTFDEVKINKNFRIFKNETKYMAVIFNKDASLKLLEKELNKIKKPISLYVFSLFGDGGFKKHLKKYKNVKITPVPEALLRVYNENLSQQVIHET